VNEAIYESIVTADEDAIWVMQGWLFLNNFWNPTTVEAFLSKVPKVTTILILTKF
jgi:alpha-N-acetylglucosaminidase